ncbi:MAG: glycosyltransferase family 39 protein [Lachnospiraceae bacterium]|nr:glycosyltransferase family 39 protein [Lachnospiraceae bacterium]
MPESNVCSRERLVSTAAFAFFVLVALHKLTGASLWYDEAIEYWYSKVMVGGLPWELSPSPGMYDRINYTFQPPLYNFVMFFWLLIGTSEWWFRFFGVIMGFVGMLGLFHGIRRVTGNEYLASGAVFFSSFVYELAYYWQECAEYCLLLGMLFMTVCFWLHVIIEPERKYVIAFTVFAVLSMYSQYGAAFPVFALALTAAVSVLLRKKKGEILCLVITYGAAFVGAGLPLYFFFLRKQLLMQQGGELAPDALSFKGGIIKDFFDSLLTVFRWNMMSVFDRSAACVVLVLLLIGLVVVTIFGGAFFRWLAAANVLTWLAYYVAVKLGLYGYGNFGNRYGLFFLPLWLATDFVMLWELYYELSEHQIWRLPNLHVEFAGIVLAACLCFCFVSWSDGISENWNKFEDNRQIVDAWYENGGENSHTLVYYGSAPAFAYYIRQNEKFDPAMEKNIGYMPFYRDQSEETYDQLIRQLFGGSFPGEVYVAFTHNSDDIYTVLNIFLGYGYTPEMLYEGEGMLIRYYKE